MSKRLNSVVLILFTIILMATILNWIVTPIQTGDLFMYLSMGKYFLTQNFYPAQDPFLFIQGGGNHFHHEWLSYVFYYVVEKAGGLNAIIVARVALYALLFSIPIWFALKRDNFNYRTLGLLVLAVVSMATRVGDRSFFFSDLFTALLITLLFLVDQQKERKYLFLLPLIFLAWVQFHPGFPLGLLILSVYFVFNLFRLDRDILKWLFASISLSYLVCILNPLGFSGFLYPFEIFFSKDWNIYREINSEWVPLFSSSVADFAKGTTFILFLLSLGSSLFELRKRNFFPFFVTLVFAYLTYSSMRFISIAPLVFALISVAYPMLPHLKRIRYLVGISGVASLVGVAILAFHVSKFDGQGVSFLFSEASRVKAPMQMFEGLKSLEPGTIFAEWDWNSIICFVSDGRHKVVVHGHIDQPRFAVDNFYNLGLSVKEFDQIVETNQVRYFLLKLDTLNSNSIIATKLLNPPWKVVFKENDAVLFAKK
jgi:hypothetical protein